MRPDFSHFADFETWLRNLGMFHMDFDLARMREALAACQLEKWPFKIVQVVGTNGKGSTCAFLERLAREHGLKTGLYTSPHFISPRERVLVNGQQVDDGIWLGEASRLVRATGDMRLTYFETLTLLCLLIFKRLHVELAILEAGLGGAHDATTAVAAHALCLTPIAMDHADIIGPDLSHIAQDKAGAIRPDTPAFSAPQFPLAEQILRQEARRLNAPLRIIPGDLPKHLRPGLAGEFQKINASLALSAWRHMATSMGITPQTELEQRAMAKAFIPGRLQIISATHTERGLILDGGHNPHCMRNLAHALQALAMRPARIVYSALADKNWKAALGILAGQFPDIPIFIPQLHNPRAADAEQIASWLNKQHPHRAEYFNGQEAVAQAVNTAFDMEASPVLVTGSLYLLAEFYRLFPQYLYPNHN